MRTSCTYIGIEIRIDIRLAKPEKKKRKCKTEHTIKKKSSN